MKVTNLKFRFFKYSKQVPLFYGLNLFLIFLICFESSGAKASEKIDEGKIIEADPFVVIGKVNSEEFPEGIPFVTVRVDGTTIGTVTDIEGNFKLEVPTEESVLVFSAVGFVSQSIKVGSQRVVNVTFAEDVQALEEVVVVGFGGTQRKESLVSSITSVSAKELKVNSTNLTNALAGRIPGVISYQRSGEPGEDNSDFFIRGLGTFGAGKRDPLILIDNIESSPTDLARLQADDIEAFSVLKDATAAAVYGARGANGVILVNTKSGEEGKTKFQLRMSNKISTNTKNFQLADNLTYMELENESVVARPLLSSTPLLPYSNKQIDFTKAGTDPLLYPSNDWMDILVKPYTMNQAYNISASGGGKRARYYLAGTYNVDNGVLNIDPINDFNNNIKLLNYSLRSNVNIQLTKNLEGVVRIYGQFDDYTGPLGGTDRYGNGISGGTRIFNLALSANPVSFPALYPRELLPYVDYPLFGGAPTRSGGSLLANPYAEAVKGYEVRKSSTLMPQIELNQNLSFVTPGLKMGVMGYIRRYSSYSIRRSYTPFYHSAVVNPVSGEVVLDILNDGEQGSIGSVGNPVLNFESAGSSADNRVYLQSTINYNRNFQDKHNVSGMLIYLIQSYETGTPDGNLQSSLPKRNQGISGRFSYGFDNRYLAEFNFGFNGSERFSKKNRYGFFPSFGLAYHISNETFWAPVSSVIDDLKLRFSYGFVGNDQIGNNNDRFFYLSNVDLNSGTYGARFGEDYLLGANRKNGIIVNRYANELISWETSEQYNLGIDMTLFNSVDIVTEIFRQTRSNILQPRSYIGSVMGLNPSAEPKANTGKAASQGIDVSVVYSKFFSQNKSLQIRSNLTYSTSEFLEYDEVDYPAGEGYRSVIGNSVSQQYGYIAERLFVDDNEVFNSPQQFGFYQGGDIKYRDVNGDGVISAADRVPLGYPTVPEIIYGFGATFAVNQFDLGFFFQGAARTSFFIDSRRISPFVQVNSGGTTEQNGLLNVIADSHWSELDGQQDLYAFWPRLSNVVIENNVQTSTWWMRNGSFLRLKSVEAGYNFPEAAANRLHLDNLRLYLRGTNLFSLSKFKLWDVEMGGNGLGYPIQSIYAVGMLVNF